jgi:hypothetical protein
LTRYLLLQFLQRGQLFLVDRFQALGFGNMVAL